MQILRENLALALRITIEMRSEEEKTMGYHSNSAFVAGLKDVLTALQSGERVIYIK